MLFLSHHRYLEEPKPTGKDLEYRETSNAEQSLFIQEVLLATLTDSRLTLQSGDDSTAEPSGAVAMTSPSPPRADTATAAVTQASVTPSPASSTDVVHESGRGRTGPIIAQATPDPDERR